MTENRPTSPRIADAARRIRHVFVRDLRLEAAIGVWRHEHGRLQPIRLNIDLGVQEPPDGRDELAEVVCYQQVVDMAKALVASRHVKLVETLAEMIAEGCLADPRVLTVRVRVEKLDAVPEAASVGVEIERLRRGIGP